MRATRKSVSCEFKARKTPGEFEAEYSVFGNVDLDGDRILKGALDPAIASNPNPPVVWTHSWDIPPIGETLEQKSTDSGGTAVGRLFLDDHEVARQVWAGVKSAALKEYSFAFGNFEFSLVETKDGESSSRSDGRVREITTIKEMYEWGPTLKGANSLTSTLSKSAARALFDVKSWGDIDSWEISCLTAMVDYGTSFIVSEDDPDDVATMKGILNSILVLLTKEMGEEPDAEATQYLSFLARTLKGTTKRGARHNADDLSRIQMLHDITSELLAGESTVEDGADASDEADAKAVLDLFSVRPMLHLHS